MAHCALQGYRDLPDFSSVKFTAAFPYLTWLTVSQFLLPLKKSKHIYIYIYIYILRSCDRASWTQGEKTETNKMQLIWCLLSNFYLRQKLYIYIYIYIYLFIYLFIYSSCNGSSHNVEWLHASRPQWRTGEKWKEAIVA